MLFCKQYMKNNCFIATFIILCYICCSGNLDVYKHAVLVADNNSVYDVAKISCIVFNSFRLLTQTLTQEVVGE